MTGDNVEAVRHLLPPDAYTSDEWYAREQHCVFARSWTVVAHADDVRDPGDFTTAVVGGAPIAIVRHPDGGLRAFHNLCRHRGMVMLDGRGNTGDEVSCFYHGWRYDLDGALRVVPQRKTQFPDLDTRTCGLLPVAVEEWEGMVFVNAGANGVALSDALGPFPDHIGSHRPGRLALVGSADVPAACNWKLLVENHIDVYHLWYLHRDSLGAFDHSQFEHQTVGRNWVSYEPVRAHDAGAVALSRGTIAIAGLDERDRTGLGAHLVFPNTLMASNNEFFMSYAVVAESPDRSRIEVRIRAEPGADGAALVGAARSFIEEDVRACERIQAGLRSPWFAVGPLAVEHEAPITAFHRNLLELLA